jgi:hypothetical protein
MHSKVESTVNCGTCAQEGENHLVNVWSGVARPRMIVSLGSGNGAIPEGAVAVQASRNASTVAAKTMPEMLSTAEKAMTERRRSRSPDRGVPAAARESIDILSSFDESDEERTKEGSGDGGFLGIAGLLFGDKKEKAKTVTQSPGQEAALRSAELRAEQRALTPRDKLERQRLARQQAGRRGAEVRQSAQAARATLRPSEVRETPALPLPALKDNFH